METRNDPVRGAPDSFPPPGPRHGTLTYRGVNYDVGTRIGGYLSRAHWDPLAVRNDMRAIRRQLHCDSVIIYGTDLERLFEGATIALETGLHVWLEPRLHDAEPAHTLEHLAETARAADGLRELHSDVYLILGSALSVHASGILSGDDIAERVATLEGERGQEELPVANARLNRLLNKALTIARSDFYGKITYAAGLWENVDWRGFDIIGLNYYRTGPQPANVSADLRPCQRRGLPVVITEFGCPSYRGAEEHSPDLDEAVDRSYPVPQLRTEHTRDEQVQADHITELLQLFRSERLAGAFVFEFLAPNHPHSADPRYDLDMVSYSLVRSLPEGTGRGAPRWEPKAAFNEVAQIYRDA